ncbi:regulator of G-protein signaling 22-like isoform X5 [Ptychodera flava]|uniref:regulator of G-protein signaling 22-like isoform X5 n=1 Tax=Ptychodera flava TaxID=63121 RepID=UPI00396A380F
MLSLEKCATPPLEDMKPKKRKTKPSVPRRAILENRNLKKLSKEGFILTYYMSACRAFTAIEVTEDNFEALLAYDDLFLDYFNAFLQLPAFPQPLYYNRLTGTFQEVESQDISASLCDVTPPAQFAPSEEERVRIIEWARKDRLPLFLRTKLFLEYKLCKLLVRPLDDRSSSCQSSRGIYGYSRQTTSYATSSLGNSRARSTFDEAESDTSMPWAADIHRSALMGRYLRPGSRAQSVPPDIGLGLHINLETASSHSSSGHFSSTGNSRRAKSGTNIRHSEDSADPQPPQTLSTKESWVPVSDSGVATAAPDNNQTTPASTSGQSRRKSALKTPNSRSSTTKKQTTIRIPQIDDEVANPVSANQNETETEDKKNVGIVLPPITGSLNDLLTADYDGHQNHLAEPGFDDIDVDGEPNFVEFEDADEYISDVQTEADVREMESRLKRTFQQLKEEMMGSISGMELFRDFLQSTVGMDMLNFWLDCEQYHDNSQAIDDMQSKLQRNRLFRDIQDRYKFKLSEDAKEHIKRAQENEGLSESVFTKTQYDILRRMRTYWVPRFLIHQEAKGEFSLATITEGVEQEPDMNEDRQLTNMNFLPSISLVNSLPVRPESCVRLAQNSHSWDAVVSGGHKMEDEIKPGQLAEVPTPEPERPYASRFRQGITNDKDAGGPFQRYLESCENSQFLANFLFWQDVTDYGQAEDRSADRLLRIRKAWAIFNRYIALGSIWDIGISPYERDTIHHKLLTTRDYVEASLYDNARDHSVKMLQREWLKYLKNDLRTFLECRARPDDMIYSPSPTPPDSRKKPKTVRRPWVRRALPPLDDDSCPGSTESQRQRRLLQSLQDAEKINAARSPDLKKKQEKDKRKKQQAAARKKMLKKMKKGKMGGKKKSSQVTIKTPGEENKDGEKKDEKSGEKETEKEITFSSTYRNRTLMNQFKRFLSDDEEKEYFNSLNMYLDIETYQRLPDAHIEKKHTQLRNIVGTYFDQTSKKFVNLPAEIVQVLAREGDRPRNSVLNACQKAVKQELEEQFKIFWLAHLESLEAQGLGGDNSNAMSKVEMAMKSESTQSLLMDWKRRRRARGPTSDPTSQTPLETPIEPQLPTNSQQPPAAPETSPSLLQPVQSKAKESHSDSSQSPSSPTSGCPTFEPKKAEKVKRIRRKHYKQPGKQAPSTQDKNEFLHELMVACRGEKPIRLQHFQKYLTHHGENDNMPNLPNDLDFWLEAQRFKDAHHAYSDLVLLKKKVEVIIDCFLDSQASSSSVQIDIPADIAQKLIRHGESYIRDRGKDPHNPNLFDEAQYTVFKEMLPYWAGYLRQYDAKKLERAPSMSKTQKLTKERLKAYLEMEEPSTVFRLPSVNPNAKSGATIITFSISEGLQWKDVEGPVGERSSSMATVSQAGGFTSRRESMLDSKRPGRVSAVSSDGSSSTARQRAPRINIEPPRISVASAAQ